MYEHNSLDKKSLLIQLENYKLILEVNSDLLESDQLLREKISHTMGMLESRLEELEEITNDQIKYVASIDQANRILEEIKVLTERLLDQDAWPQDNNLQNPAESQGFY